MKNLIVFLFGFAICMNGLQAQVFVTSAEAEDGVLIGTTIAPATGSSSGPYVTGFDNNGDKVTV